MRFLRSILLPLIVVCPIFSDRPLAAQVSGRVTEEESGQPIAGATVELWASLRRTAQATTDADGRFAFDARAAEGATGVRAHRLGLQSVSLALGGETRDLAIRMAPAPLEVAGVTSAAAPARRRVCPNREDPRARALWTRMRARYAVPDSLPAIRLFSEQYDAEVPYDEIGVVDTIRPRQARFETLPRVGVDGTLSGAYARPMRVNGVVHWEYAPLAWGFNQHFVRASFGERHTLSMVPNRRGQPVLAFCPRNGREAGIEGTLTLAADTSLHSARWLYRTPRPRDEAGGEVQYLPPVITLHQLLFADRSLFWRRRFGGRFYFRHDRWRAWEISGERVLSRPGDGSQRR